MSFVATHPEKLDSTKSKQWQKIANLKDKHMHAISNLEYLGVAVYKRDSGSTGLNFGGKKKRQTRKLRTNEDGEEQWELSRYQPVLSEASSPHPPTFSLTDAWHTSSLVAIRQPRLSWGITAANPITNAMDDPSLPPDAGTRP